MNPGGATLGAAAGGGVGAAPLEEQAQKLIWGEGSAVRCCCVHPGGVIALHPDDSVGYQTGYAPMWSPEQTWLVPIWSSVQTGLALIWSLDPTELVPS